MVLTCFCFAESIRATLSVFREEAVGYLGEIIARKGHSDTGRKEALVFYFRIYLFHQETNIVGGGHGNRLLGLFVQP